MNMVHVCVCVCVHVCGRACMHVCTCVHVCMLWVMKVICIYVYLSVVVFPLFPFFKFFFNVSICFCV